MPRILHYRHHHSAVFLSRNRGIRPLPKRCPDNLPLGFFRIREVLPAPRMSIDSELRAKALDRLAEQWKRDPRDHHNQPVTVVTGKCGEGCKREGLSALNTPNDKSGHYLPGPFGIRAGRQDRYGLSEYRFLFGVIQVARLSLKVEGGLTRDWPPTSARGLAAIISQYKFELVLWTVPPRQRNSPCCTSDRAFLKRSFTVSRTTDGFRTPASRATTSPSARAIAMRTTGSSPSSVGPT